MKPLIKRRWKYKHKYITFWENTKNVFYGPEYHHFMFPGLGLAVMVLINRQIFLWEFAKNIFLNIIIWFIPLLSLEPFGCQFRLYFCRVSTSCWIMDVGVALGTWVLWWILVCTSKTVAILGNCMECVSWVCVLSSQCSCIFHGIKLFLCRTF